MTQAAQIDDGTTVEGQYDTVLHQAYIKLYS